MNGFKLMTVLFLPAMAGLIGHIIGRKNERIRDIFIDVIGAIELLLVTILYPVVSKGPIEALIPGVMGTGIFLKMDMFRYIFVWISVFIWFLATMYTQPYFKNNKNTNGFYLFFMITLSNTIGIFISENILSLFTFFELMALTSYVLVIQRKDEKAHDAGRLYLSFSVASGMVTLMGIYLLYYYTGVLNIGEINHQLNGLGNIRYVIGILLSVGFLVKASMFPLHVWLPKTYTFSPAPVTAILSGILAKAGVYGVMIISLFIMDGDVAFSTGLLVFSLMSMFIGGFLALFQKNIKKILAYSSMSQVGYMLMGVALIGLLKGHGQMALIGATYHVVNHALFKVLLFMGVGVIYTSLGDLNINKIKGFGKDKGLLKILFLIGILGVTGVPGFNGFISKSILHHSLLELGHEYHGLWMKGAEGLFTISSAFTVAYLLKLFIAVFVEKGEDRKGVDISIRALIPMIILSIGILFVAINPQGLIHIMDKAKGLLEAEHRNVHLEFYTWENTLSSLKIILIGIGIYLLFIRRHLILKGAYINPSEKWISLEENMYMPLSIGIYKGLAHGFSVIDRSLESSTLYIASSIKKLAHFEIKYEKYYKYENFEEGYHRLSDLIRKVEFRFSSVNYALFVILALLIGFIISLMTF